MKVEGKSGRWPAEGHRPGKPALGQAVSSRPPMGFQKHLGRVSPRLIGAGESDKLVKTKTALMELG